MKKLLRSVFVALVLFIASSTPISAIDTLVDSSDVSVGTTMNQEHSSHYLYILGILVLTGSIVGMYQKKYDED
ncbi:hypothetical protein AOC36_08790 [Erysipelothrix larvae]|uniref:Gram-positive cocci surface proteins LPxTG domain-containing protein n=1 Tax=Erysipelothrix larvae TaxID=1514105 RepID=A0A109UHD9_9FIRM|nr:hypothetical protein [Erysipelothrix larvae]AMC94081.1 hypothetical protein AOC36_08790 [Erysipelothrix larvae]